MTEVLEVLRVAGKIGGIGGISLGLVLLLFREILKLGVFSKLTKNQTYRILNLILVLTAVVALAGLATWFLTQTRLNRPSTGDSLRDGVTDQLRSISEQNAMLLREIAAMRGSIAPTDPGLEMYGRRLKTIERRTNELESHLGQPADSGLSVSLRKTQQDLAAIRRNYATVQQFHLTNDPDILLKLAPNLALAVIDTPERKEVYRGNERLEFTRDAKEALKSGAPKKILWGNVSNGELNCVGAPEINCVNIEIDSHDGSSASIQWHSRQRRTRFDQTLETLDRGRLATAVSMLSGTVCAWYERAALRSSSASLLELFGRNPLAAMATAPAISLAKIPAQRASTRASDNR